MGLPFCNNVREIVLILSSSRGGSSLLAESLRACRKLLHLPGESKSLLVAAGIDPLCLSGCERLDSVHADKFGDALARQFTAEVGNPAHRLVPEQLMAWLDRRLRLQWPDEDFSAAEISHGIAMATDRLAAANIDAGAFAALSAFQLDLVETLRENHPNVDPYYYDIDEAEVARRFPGLPVPQGPPGRRLVEVPPFLVTRPWQLTEDADLADRPLVLKDPCAAYQMPFYRALFPNARFRIVHLTRAPGPAVHGMAKAWLHRGFFTRQVGADLSIDGYSDRVPWGRHWWNFDFPPGWQDMVDQPLLRVCAFQWASAHRAILESIRPGDDVVTLRHEDFVGGPEVREKTIRRLGDWLELIPSDLDALLRLRLTPVAATATPSESRWLGERTAILPALANPAVAEIASALGY